MKIKKLRSGNYSVFENKREYCCFSTEKEAEEFISSAEEFKKYFFKKYAGAKELTLRETVLEDRINEKVIKHKCYSPPIEEIFKNIPSLEKIYDKAEDSWEGGIDLWNIFYRGRDGIERTTKKAKTKIQRRRNAI